MRRRRGSPRSASWPLAAERQRPQRAGLDDAADPVLRDGARVQPVQQRQGRTGTILGEQDACQQQMFGFGWIAWLVASAEALLVRPAGRARQVTLGQEQPCPFRGTRVEQAVYRGTGANRPASPIASKAPAWSPSACRIQARVIQASRERGGSMSELTAQA